MATHDGSFLGEYLPYLLRRADQSLSASFYAVLNDYGVARSEWRLLAVLESLGELTVLDLAAASLSPQPTITHALRRLEDRGLVSRIAGTDDRRQRFVSITAQGSTLARALMTEARSLQADALGQAGDLGPLVDQLKTLTAMVEERANPDGRPNQIEQTDMSRPK